MSTFDVTLFGHRPSKLFIIATGGRVDRLFARLVLWVSVRTWGRYTRWYPQNIVTIAAMVYFAGGLGNLWMTHQLAGWEGALTAFVVVAVTAFLEFQSWQCRGLSRDVEELSIWDILQARKAAATRMIAGPVVLISVALLGASLSLPQLIQTITFLGWMWALYTVTMGRTGLPPKKGRRWLKMPTLPRLPRLLPVPS